MINVLGTQQISFCSFYHMLCPLLNLTKISKSVKCLYKFLFWAHSGGDFLGKYDQQNSEGDANYVVRRGTACHAIHHCLRSNLVIMFEP